VVGTANAPTPSHKQALRSAIGGMSDVGERGKKVIAVGVVQTVLALGTNSLANHAIRGLGYCECKRKQSTGVAQRISLTI
jgi:hypothetical protein